MNKAKRTAGGQIVGREPLTCENTRASADYCMHCDRSLAYTGEPRVPCKVLENLRLREIPDDDVAAFGCWREEPGEEPPCEKWCHRKLCAYTLKPSASIQTKGTVK